MSAECRAAFAENQRSRAKRQMSNPDIRLKIAKAVSESHKKAGNKSRFKMTASIREKISLSQRGRKKEWMNDASKVADASAKVSKAHAERFANIGIENHELFQPDVRKRALEKSAIEAQTNPRRGKYETNIHALDWHLRSPSGKEYHFKNLRHFIRRYHYLFTSHQLEVNNINGRTRIEACLSLLSHRNVRPVTCSQGWTWIMFHKECDPRC